MSKSFSRKSLYRLKSTGEVKVVVTLVLPKSLYEEVLEVAPKVFGVQRGALSRAVEEGLKLWLARVRGVPGGTRGAHCTQRGRSTLRERYGAWLKCIEERMGQVPHTLPQEVAVACVMDAFDIKDIRSVYGWLYRFYVAGLIEPLTVQVKHPSDWRKNKAIRILVQSPDDPI